MRQYLISGYLNYAGGQQRLLSATATLSENEVMDPATMAEIQRQLLAENNRTKTIAEGLRITAFQPFELPPTSVSTSNMADIQLNECGTVLPPVDSPLLIEVAPGVLLRATRPVHIERKNGQLAFDLFEGGQYIGRPRWTHQ